MLSAQNSRIDLLQEKIEVNFQKDPVKAGEYLKLLLEEEGQLHDTVAAKAYAKLGITYVKTANYDAAFPFFEKGILKASSFPQLKAEISTSMAIAFRSASNHQESLSILTDVLKIYEASNNQIGIATVYGEMASNYNYMLEDEKSIEYLQKGIQILEKEKSWNKLAVLRQKLANNYFNNGKYDFAKELYEDVLPVFEKEGSINYYYTLLNYGDCLFYLEDLQAALKSFKKAEEGLYLLNNEEFALFALSKVARVYRQLDQISDAKESYQKAFDGMYRRVSPRLTQVVDEYLDLLNTTGAHDKALEIIQKFNSLSVSSQKPVYQNYRDRLEFLHQSYVAHKNSRNFEEALVFSEKLQSLQDSINNVRNEERIAEVQEKYQNRIQKEKNELLESNILLLNKNIKRKNSIIYLGLLVGCLVLAIIYFSYKRLADRVKLKRLTIENLSNKKIILEEKHKIQEAKRIEQEQLIELKQREMVAISIELANIQRKIEMLISKDLSQDNFGSFKTKLLNVLNEKNYWIEFQKRFSEVHPEFYSNLKDTYPTLTKSELQFCSFLKLGLTNKEIATLHGISPQSVITKKYRIKKKLDIHDEDEFEFILKAVRVDLPEKALLPV